MLATNGLLNHVFGAEESSKTLKNDMCEAFFSLLQNLEAIESKQPCLVGRAMLHRMASSAHVCFESFLLASFLLSLSISLTCCIQLGSLHARLGP